MSLYDQKLAELDATDQKIKMVESDLTRLHERRGALASWIEGYLACEAAEEVTALPKRSVTADVSRETQRAPRRDIEGPVMDLLAHGSMSADSIVIRTGLPETSVKAFLGRNVKAGKIEQDGALYGLPQKRESVSPAQGTATGDATTYEMAAN